MRRLLISCRGSLPQQKSLFSKYFYTITTNSQAGAASTKISEKASSKDQSNDGLFSAVRDIFSKKSLTEDHESAVKDNIKRETNYLDIVKQLENTKGDKGPLAGHLRDIQVEITKAIESSFDDEDINKLMRTGKP